MPTNIPVMPILFIVLLLLPVRVSPPRLKALAFALWLTGGLFLAFRGVHLLTTESLSLLTLVLVVAAALIIGIAKGQFVLAKTSRRNIERLGSLTEPQRPIHVYSLRSWIIIGVMVAISVALNVLAVPAAVRGPVNLGIGAALIVSSLAYLRKNARVEGRAGAQP